MHLIALTHLGYLVASTCARWARPPPNSQRRGSHFNPNPRARPRVRSGSASRGRSSFPPSHREKPREAKRFFFFFLHERGGSRKCRACGGAHGTSCWARRSTAGRTISSPRRQPFLKFRSVGKNIKMYLKVFICTENVN